MASPEIRSFDLIRDEDETGVSGVGVVAHGVRFADGHIAMRWLTDTASTAIYSSIVDVRAIHGHAGKTRVRWHAPQVFRPGRQWTMDEIRKHATDAAQDVCEGIDGLDNYSLEPDPDWWMVGALLTRIRQLEEEAS